MYNDIIGKSLSTPPLIPLFNQRGGRGKLPKEGNPLFSKEGRGEIFRRKLSAYL